ncbi:hypothetical protein [Lactobacillus amylolyticus]|uniref:hypothetical protein n=1 Tax=Lactobacillus amylolyticus TaxID=83683 RepID=UPI0024926967|nr:hypothetical protein [Lactobacillus amylolyticus]
MGLFKNKEERTEAKEEKIRNWLSERGLENLSPEYFRQASRIKNKFWGTSWLSSFGNEQELLKNINWISQGISEQNWLLIKQNDQLIKQNQEIIELLKNK